MNIKNFRQQYNENYITNTPANYVFFKNQATLKMCGVNSKFRVKLDKNPIYAIIFFSFFIFMTLYNDFLNTSSTFNKYLYLSLSVDILNFLLSRVTLKTFISK